MIPTPREGAERLAAKAIRDGFQFEALHVYRETSGAPLYWRIRLKHPGTGEKWIRPMKLDGARYVIGEPPFADGAKPLYRLDDLARRPGEAVFVVEGEKCADALQTRGVLATTSGGADSAGKADWGPLTGRVVTLWPDNDEPGGRMADEAAARLAPLGCTVRRVDVARLALPAKGDCVDWFEAHPEAVAADVEALACVEAVAAAATAEGVPAPVPLPTGAALTAEVLRLASLPPIEYAQARKSEAKRLGVSTSALDAAVKARVPSAGASDTMFTDVEPWPDPVDGAALLRELGKTVDRFIVCEVETSVAAALWIAFTWFVDNVKVAPLAIITAPEKRCGKSQLLALMGRLVRRPLLASNITSAAVFRVIEAHKPTLLIDEADTFLRENEEMRGVINSGHTRDSAFVVRTVGEEHEPQKFSTWGAKALCGIGKMPDTLMDRAVVLTLRRKLPGERVERQRHADERDFTRLARMLARFAADAGESIAASRPDLPEALNDRAQDNWEPLLAIADHVGAEWPQVARAAALKLAGAEEEPASIAVELLTDVRTAVEENPGAHLSSTELLAKLTADDTRRWASFNHGRPMTPHQLAKRLGEFGIRSENARIGGRVLKGYPAAAFADAFARYLRSPVSSATPLHAAETPQEQAIAP